VPSLKLLPDASARPPDALLVLADSWIDNDPDSGCLHVVGELDIASAPQLQLALRQALERSRLVVLDLRDLTFIDSSGVHVIVGAVNRAREIGRRLVVVRGYPIVDRMFAAAGALDVLEPRGAGETG